MDITQETRSYKIGRAKKMMLWFGIASMVMMFAGITSAYVVSKNRPDWISDFELPETLYWSTLVIIISSITFMLAKRAILKESRSQATVMLLTTLALGILFVDLQFRSFSEIIASGYYFTGSESTITTSFIYVVVLLHLAHLTAGLIVLLVVIYNHFKQRYKKGQMLGIELGVTFWHFLDALWVYLFVFLYFFR
ncbi:cytochrome c oxidase subunit 3 [Gillisia mitskevichiae]|uniref:Cytochrome c oxidase subunit 3 n=1 Tax=Gillisia mitskevichiae TaxID=270921 RepID=A0A495PZJ9_9FLAO|nr:cytochrome c oxidase subunit 3 [Gillisia mitskevichiae]RKS55952.1 cytochrome c oxidase subunit 3 [Gillisia mitskevichiae]